jgi:transposase
LSGSQNQAPGFAGGCLTIPPSEIQDLWSLFSTYRLCKKQTTQIKNRVHSLLKEKLYGFTQEEIFGKLGRASIREIEKEGVLGFQVNQLLDKLEHDEADIETLKNKILVQAEPFMPQIEILTSMKGISVFIAVAIIADIINVNRFKDSKHFTSYLRSAPHVANSKTSTSIRGTNKKGRAHVCATFGDTFDPVVEPCFESQSQTGRVV